MTLSFDSLAVGVIVLAASAWAGRSLYGALRHKRICDSCSSSGACPLVTDKGRPAALVPDLEPLAKSQGAETSAPKSHLPS